MTRGSRATRVAGGIPMIVGLASAAALTGAAFFTVQQAGCGDPGAYYRHDGLVELIGGCVDTSDLPGARTGPQQQDTPGDSGLTKP